MDAANAIEVDSVSKSFGEVAAVNDVSFQVKYGEIFGIVGPNGAGKTTILRMIIDIFRPDDGEIRVVGRRVDAWTNEHIGYLPEERGIYVQFKIRELLEYFAALKGCSRAQAKAGSEWWLKRFGLWDVRDRRVDTLSKGNQQKVQLMVTLVADPEVVILDEPLSGLDPVNARELIEAMRELAAKGKAVIFSSHQMTVVESVCDRVLMIYRGKTVFCGSLQEIRESYALDNQGIVPPSLEEIYVKVVKEER